MMTLSIVPTHLPARSRMPAAAAMSASPRAAHARLSPGARRVSRVSVRGLASARATAGFAPGTRASASRPSRPRLVLFGSQGSRSPLVNWWLHELGVPFALRPPHDSGNPHPFGQIPALLDFTDVEDDERAETDGVKLWESGAILAYLADRHGPLDTPARRADAGKWIHWANASLDPCLFKENERGQVLDTGARVRPGQTPPRALERLEKELERSSRDARRGWLATVRSDAFGDDDVITFPDTSFGVADVAVGSYLLYVPQFFPEVSFARWPHIAAFMKACASRPAYAEAYGEDVAAYLVEKCEAWTKK